MPPAVIAAGIGALGAIGGSLLSSSAQKSASNQATQATTDAQNQATQAQLQLGQESLDQQRQMYNSNLGLQTDIYNQGFNMLSPYATNGMVASNSVNALLGLPSTAPIQSTVRAPAPIAASTSGTAAGTGNALGSGAPVAIPGNISAMANDGVPGNYASNLTQYFQQNPPTMAQIQAMQADGIPGNYRAAMAARGAPVAQSSGGIPGIISPVGALLTGGGIFG